MWLHVRRSRTLLRPIVNHIRLYDIQAEALQVTLWVGHSVRHPAGKERKCDRWRTRRFRHIPRGMTGSPSLKVKVGYIGRGVATLRESRTLKTHHSTISCTSTVRPVIYKPTVHYPGSLHSYAPEAGNMVWTPSTLSANGSP